MRAAGLGLVAVLALFSGGCRHAAEKPQAAWQIVFRSDRGGEFALWSIRPDGIGLVRIDSTNPAPDGGPPVVAPGGTKLLLPDSYELVVVDADGRRRLASGEATAASWSSDGKRIAFPGRSPGLSVIGADGKNGRRLTRNAGDSEPVWSPTHDTIAFTRQDAGVLAVEADGTDQRVLWRGSADSLAWSKDGRTLSFLRRSDYGRTGALITVDVATARVVRTVRGVDVDLYAPFARSPDARRIVFERSVGSRRDRFELVVMNSDGTGARRVAGPRDHASSPTWAPDGRSIVYTRDGVDGTQLWTVRADGSGRRPITHGLPDGGNAESPAWARIPFRNRPSPFRVRARRTQTGGELNLPFPVVSLGASGSRVALAAPVRVYAPVWILTPPLVVWDAATGTVSRLAMRSCDVPDSIVLAGGEVAFDCRWIPHAVAYFGGSVYVSSNHRRRAVALNLGQVDGERGKPGSLPGRVAGARGAVVFAVDAFTGHGDYAGSTLWRVRGRRSERVAANVGEPVAVDRGRVVTEHPQGHVALLDLDGHLMRVFAPGGRGETPPVYGARRPPTVGLSNRDVIVLRGERLSWYDAASGRLRRVSRVEQGAVLAGVADGLVAYVAGSDIHVVRLHDGKKAVFRAHGLGVKARLTGAGLFYTSHRHAVKYRTMQQHERNPARVTFVRRAALVARLR